MPKLGSINLRSDFSKGGPINQVPASWYNTVANFIKTLIIVGGTITYRMDGHNCTLFIDEASKNPQQQYSFMVTKITTTSVFVTDGYCSYAANAKMHLSGTTLTVGATGQVYIKLDFLTGVFDAPIFAAATPANTDSVQYFLLADVQWSNGQIASIVQRRMGDIDESRA